MLRRRIIHGFSACLTGLIMVSCAPRRNPSETFYYTDTGHKLSVGFDNKIRLEGLFPGVYTSFGYSGQILKKQKSPSGCSYVFKNSQIGEEAELIFKLLENRHVLCIYLKAKAANGSDQDPIELLFDSVPDLMEGMALHRYSPVKAWTRPDHFSSFDELDSADNQFIYWRYRDSIYAAAMPLGGNGTLSSIGQRHGKLRVYASGGTGSSISSDTIPLMAIAFGRDFYQIVGNLVEVSVGIMGYPENIRTKKEFPKIFEKLGWCTWNAFMHDVDEKKILDAAKSFQDKNIPLGYLLIDDGWLITDDNKLVDYSPDRKKFPRGFRPMVDELQKRYGIDEVGVWHTLNGYWEGIKEGSPIQQKFAGEMHAYKDRIIWLRDTVSTIMIPSPATGALTEFYNNWYDYLKDQGISFVKVDNQNVINQLATPQLSLWDAGELAERDLQQAIATHFEGAVINCMDMSSNTVYHFGSSAVARAVEDYYPADNNLNYKLEFSCNAAGHILMSLFNSIWFSGFVYPDYDMFQSHRSDAEYHAIARAISGGPVYLTDIPGRQNREIINKMILNDGTILRADQPSLPTEDCLFQLEGGRPFKAFSKEGNAGLLVAWNASDTSLVSGTIRPADVVGLKGDTFAVYDHFSQKVKILAYQQSDSIEIGRMGQKLFIIVPVEDDITPIGLLDKYNSPATILSVENSAGKCLITLLQGGIFGAFCRKIPLKVFVNQREIEEERIIWDKGLLRIDANDSKDPVKIEIVYSQ